MDILEFYASQSPYTDPGKYAQNFGEVEFSTVEDVKKIVNGVMMDFMDRWKHPIQNERWLETSIRYTDEMIEAIWWLDRKFTPLLAEHAPDLRMMASSSHFTSLAISMLRYLGIPARKRAGFVKSGEFYAEYDIIDKMMAYDMVEYYDKASASWKLFDAEGRGEGFTFAADVYKACRAGKADPKEYYIEDSNGMECVNAVLVHDFDALCKSEVLTWDFYGIMDIDKAIDKYSDEDWALLDKVADLIAADDKNVDALMAMYESNKCLQIPRMLFCDSPLLPPHKMVTRVIE